MLHDMLNGLELTLSEQKDLSEAIISAIPQLVEIDNIVRGVDLLIYHVVVAIVVAQNNSLPVFFNGNKLNLPFPYIPYHS